MAFQTHRERSGMQPMTTTTRRRGQSVGTPSNIDVIHYLGDKEKREYLKVRELGIIKDSRAAFALIIKAVLRRDEYLGVHKDNLEG